MNIFKKKSTPTVADAMWKLTQEAEAQQKNKGRTEKREIEEQNLLNLFPEVMAKIEMSARRGDWSRIYVVPDTMMYLERIFLCEILEKNGFKAKKLCQNHLDGSYNEVILITWRRL